MARFIPNAEISDCWRAARPQLTSPHHSHQRKAVSVATLNLGNHRDMCSIILNFVKIEVLSLQHKPSKPGEAKGKGRVMDPIQAFLLGIMVAWTPSLIVLALALWDVR
jgi:hypothetical protein